MTQLKKILNTVANPYSVFGFVVNGAAGLFLQVILVFIGICVFVFMLWEPHLEGRNAHSTVYEVYFNDPFLAFAYAASIPFYIGLYNVLKVAGYFRQNNLLSQTAINSLQTIKICALSVAGFAVVGEIIIIMNESDDRAGGVFIGVLITLISAGIAAAVAKFETILKNTLTK